MSVVSILALGGWGDVLPLASLAHSFLLSLSLSSSSPSPSASGSSTLPLAVSTLSHTDDHHVKKLRFITHAVYQMRLMSLYPELHDHHHKSVQMVYLDIPVVIQQNLNVDDTLRPHSDDSARHSKRHRTDHHHHDDDGLNETKAPSVNADDDGNGSGHLAEMKLLYQSCDDSTLIIINLWSLIGVHIAEALTFHQQAAAAAAEDDSISSHGCRVIAISLGVVPSDAADTSSLIRSMRKRYPIMIHKLEHAAATSSLSSPVTVTDTAVQDDTCSTLSSSILHSLTTNITINDITHWMAPLWNDAYVEFREWAGLSAYWLSDCNQPSHPLPNGIPLLYAVSPSLLARPAYWPPSVHITGSWPLSGQKFADSKQRDIITNFISTRASSRSEEAKSTASGGSGICYIGFGSMMDTLIQSAASMMNISHEASRDALKQAFVKTISDSGMIGIIHGIDKTTPSSSSTSPSSAVAADSLPYTNSNEPHMMYVPNNCYVSHEWLYELCDVIIHHGGAGTTNAAIKAARPQIIIPLAFDQPWWSERIVWAGIGSKCSLSSLIPSLSSSSSSSSSSLSLSWITKGLKERLIEMRRLMKDDASIRHVRQYSDIIKAEHSSCIAHKAIASAILTLLTSSGSRPAASSKR